MFSPKRYHKCDIQRGAAKDRVQSISRMLALENIKLPSTVTEIGNHAFLNCSNLRKVILKEGLQAIGNRAFYNCTSLESIKLPSTVTEIGNNTFTYCSNLREVTLNEGL